MSLAVIQHAIDTKPMFEPHAVGNVEPGFDQRAQTLLTLAQRTVWALVMCGMASIDGNGAGGYDELDHSCQSCDRSRRPLAPSLSGRSPDDAPLTCVAATARPPLGSSPHASTRGGPKCLVLLSASMITR
jgi:hypothetical protein